MVAVVKDLCFGFRRKKKSEYGLVSQLTKHRHVIWLLHLALALPTEKSRPITDISEEATSDGPVAQAST